jgi:hypothetical protein
MGAVILLSHGRIQYHSSLHTEWKRSKAQLEDKVGKICSDKDNDNLFKRRVKKGKGTKVLMAHVPNSETFRFYYFSEPNSSCYTDTFLRSDQRSHPKRGPPQV